MRLFTFFILTFFSLSILANETFVLHYLGDAQPIILNLNASNVSNFTTNAISKIVFNFDKTSTLGLNADFNISKSQDIITIKAKSINKSIVLVKTQNNPSDTLLAAVTFIDSERIFSPVRNGMTPLKNKGKLLNFYTGNLDDETLFKLHLTISKKRFLAKDEIIFDKNITHQDYTTDKISDSKSLVNIDLDKITNGEIDNTHTYTVATSIELTYPTQNIVNLEQLGPTLISRTLDIRAQ